MPAVHGSFPRPCRVIMSRKVRTSMGRTNAVDAVTAENAPAHRTAAHRPGVTSLEEQRRRRAARQCDMDGEMPVSIGHDPTLIKKNIIRQRIPAGPVARDGSGHPASDIKAESRNLRRMLRQSYAKLIGGVRPHSAGEVQEQLVSDCGVVVPGEVAQDLASMIQQHHRPADKPAEMVLFGQVYGQLQLALEQKEKLMMKALRQRVYDAEANLEGGQQLLPLTDIRGAMAEFGIAEDSMLDAIILAFDRDSNGDGHMTFGELRSAVAGIKDPSSPFSKTSWRDKLSNSFEQIIGTTGFQSLGLSRDQKTVYSAFLDRIMPSLEDQIDFMHPSAAFVRRRKNGAGKREAPPKCKSAEPGIFGGPAFRMPTIAESGSAPVMSLADIKSIKGIPDNRNDSVNAIMKGLPPPPKKIPPTMHTSRPATQNSSASSCWSEFRERKSPFRPSRQSIEELLRADANMIAEGEQWKTVSQLEIDEPGSGLAGEKAKLKASEDRFFQKLENIQKARDNVDGRAHADLDRRDRRYENRLNNMAEIRGAVQSKVDQIRDVKVSLGNVMIPSGDLENQPKFRPGQIFEGPAMDAKRRQRRERELVHMERRSLNELKEDERQALQVKREAERLQILAEKQAKDRQKEDVREEWVREREMNKRLKDEQRKEKDGWSTDHALKGLPADVSPDCDMIPEGFTHDSIKEERRINGIMRQDKRYDVAVEGIRKHNDAKRSRITKMLWGDNPTIDLPGAVLQYVSPPKCMYIKGKDTKGTSQQKRGNRGNEGQSEPHGRGLQNLSGRGTPQVAPYDEWDRASRNGIVHAQDRERFGARTDSGGKSVF